ncbi:FGGY-family carbohydrate kinase [Deinococcus maricopensis]|uniref:Xylulokinase n=1 Tax=Deinococcus maricopensis (strain DSM 21211 / LMG 22137 / NRRL B-23946 / LB-34) TaxID=709986 RepID=E8U3R3_DEIML|nr:FGGY-family carbohydrate kinase [Deinococcus maricopensis]ADV68756.1 Xylulokinase [Deinococcus maricopensis DSM 21211]
MTPLLLALDNGTQSLRALLFTPDGTLVDKARVPFTPYVAAHPGWAEQHPDVYWDAAGQACRALWQRGHAPDAVAAVSVTAQRGTVVNVGADGRPLRPAILWLDQRRTEGLRPPGGPFGLLARAAGLHGTIRALQAETEANWIAHHQPDVWARTHKYLLLSGYLTHQLTGEYADSVGAQVGYLPFDYRRQTWAAPHDWKWRLAPFNAAHLPRLVLPGGVLGAVTRAAGAHTGLRAGTPVIAAAADKACEVLGSGGTHPGTGCLSYGTTATISVTSPRYREPRPFLPAYPAATPGAYTLEVQMFRGYWMVSWFKQEFGHAERRLAHERGVDAESLFDDLLRAAPPGSLGLTLQPYWTPGIREPGPEAKGAIIGFGDAHTRAHLYRAIIEGLAYALRDGRDQLQRRTGTPIRELRVAGGGAQSDGALQITADVFGMPVARPHVYEASGLGAAINAAVGVGLHATHTDAARAMTRPGRTFTPSADTAELYDGLYHRVYRRMYGRLKPLYHAIRDLTRDPA